MKKILILLAALCLLLAGCMPPVQSLRLLPGSTPVGMQEERPAHTLPPETEPPSPFRTDLSVEDVILYFNEVCLDAEYVSGGNPSLVQKWDEPIRYRIFGAPTEEDLRVLEDLVAWLNTVEGFPGMYPAGDACAPNLQIHFCDQDEMVELLGSNFTYADGGVTFWYDGNNRIYDAIICCRTDLDQHLRNSVILEEIYNGLGPVQDTDLRPDSLIYSGYTEPQAMTGVDELILRLLYHPDIKCGMTAAQCEQVIRQLCG